MSRLDAAPEAAAEAQACLSDGERHRVRRYRHDRDRRRFLVARARLRQLLGERLGVPPAAVELAYGRNGKPALAPRFAGSGWRFNVSHCGEVALYALSRRREVGVDVEAVRVLEEGDEIATRFFSGREAAAYRALAPRDRPLGFFNCWTRKEAFVKALGAGLSLQLDQFDVSLAPGEPARLLRIERGLGDPASWRLTAFSPLPGFVAALASRRD
jgi:4'-phosphopantetheinyl transferase